jgi:hypothetical protein
VLMPPDREILEALPPLNGPDTAVEIRGDRFPGIEPLTTGSFGLRGKSGHSAQMRGAAGRAFRRGLSNHRYLDLGATRRFYVDALPVS